MHGSSPRSLSGLLGRTVAPQRRPHLERSARQIALPVQTLTVYQDRLGAIAVALVLSCPSPAGLGDWRATDRGPRDRRLQVLQRHLALGRRELPGPGLCSANFTFFGPSRRFLSFRFRAFGNRSPPLAIGRWNPSIGRDPSSSDPSSSPVPSGHCPFHPSASLLLPSRWSQIPLPTVRGDACA
jgi:hypothetical protein